MVAQLTQQDCQPQAHNTDPQPSTSNAPVAVPPQVNSNDSSAIPSFSLWNEFDLEANVDCAPKPYREKVADELEKYLGEPLIKRNECPFKWWQERKFVYSTLFKLFIMHCNIMVTSVPCERIFSKSGYVINERRTRLSSTKMAQIVFLNVNKM
ncbi:unnamed protein product [Euphydryas editha]|uniref:HAT C-terminal dimerisation domain-containing protein n=1 Tax=Euphydryas editha TaxID=104508 RepID=A0AAU9TAT0_EUPED|nr:unnamed protein product [Euphydryas editha]